MMYKIEKICQWALRQCSKSAMSTHRLRQTLQSHLAQEKDCDALTEQVINRLQKLNILNDARVAQSIAMQYQPYGDRFIRQQLQRAQFDDITIAASISSLPPEDFRAAEVIKSLKPRHHHVSRTNTESIIEQLTKRGFQPQICQQLLEEF